MVLGAVAVVGSPSLGVLEGVWLESCEDSSTLLSGAWAGDDLETKSTDRMPIMGFL